MKAFLDNIGVFVQEHCIDMTGGWMFSCIDSFAAGWRADGIFFVFRINFAAPARFTPNTGATICVLPAPQIRRAVRRSMLRPYGTVLATSVVRRPLVAMLHGAIPCAAGVTSP